MKRIELEYFWDGVRLQVVNEPFVLEQMLQLFKPNSYLDGTIKDAFQWKSNKHMGRFFGAVASAVHEFLDDSGYNFTDKLESLKYIMENLPSETGFGLSDKWCNVSYAPNGTVVKRSAMSIAGMGRSELCELEVDLTKFLGGMGIEIRSSEEFKEKKK